MADASFRIASLAPNGAFPAAADRVFDHDVVDLLAYALCEWQRGPCVAGENRAEAVRRIGEWQVNRDPGAELWLGGLGLTSLPALLPPVRHLDVSQNALERLPGHLPCSIESLNVSGNALTALPEVLPPRLTYLDMSNNRLRKIPARLPACVSRILARDNLLEDLPQSLPFSMERLDVSGNPGQELQRRADEMIERARIQGLRFPRVGSMQRDPRLSQINTENFYCRERDLDLLRRQSGQLRTEADTPCALASRVLPPAARSMAG